MHFYQLLCKSKHLFSICKLFWEKIALFYEKSYHISISRKKTLTHQPNSCSISRWGKIHKIVFPSGV